MSANSAYREAFLDSVSWPVYNFCVGHLLCCTGALKKDDLWTQSRQNLEEAIEEEKESTSHRWDPDLLSHEQRLEQRLDKLNLDMYIMGSDGACQVSRTKRQKGTRSHLTTGFTMFLRCHLHS